VYEYENLLSNTFSLSVTAKLFYTTVFIALIFFTNTSEVEWRTNYCIFREISNYMQLEEN